MPLAVAWRMSSELCGWARRCRTASAYTATPYGALSGALAAGPRSPENRLTPGPAASLVVVPFDDTRRTLFKFQLPTM
jgi:hypothetical protein